jgi:hypothetical protein
VTAAFLMELLGWLWMFAKSLFILKDIISNGLYYEQIGRTCQNSLYALINPSIQITLRFLESHISLRLNSVKDCNRYYI